MAISMGDVLQLAVYIACIVEKLGARCSGVEDILSRTDAQIVLCHGEAVLFRSKRIASTYMACRLHKVNRRSAQNPHMYFTAFICILHSKDVWD